MLSKSTASHPRLISIDEAAELLDSSTKTVRRFVWLGELPAVRIGSRLKIDVRDLETFIRQRREGVA